MKTTESPEKACRTYGGLDLGDAFTMPVISPMCPSPPYLYKDCPSLNIIFKTDPAILKKLVPTPLQPNPDGLIVLYISFLQFAEYDLPYNEAGLLVPVIRDGKPAGTFAFALYVDQTTPVVAGREVYGWPKMNAEKILFQVVNGKITAGVTRYGQQIIQATFEMQQKVEPIPERPRTNIHFLKLIPSIKQGAPPDVLQLTSMAINPDITKEMCVGKATLKFGESPSDPFLAEMPVKEIVYAEYVVHDFTLGYGEVVVDYLKDTR